MTTSRRTQIAWIVGGILILLYTLLPIAWMVSLSLKPGGDLYNQQFFPMNWSLENYRTVFRPYSASSSRCSSRTRSPGSTSPARS
jgi:multiple sugar transport system permease protein